MTHERLPRIVPPDGLRFMRVASNGRLSPHLAPLEDPQWLPLDEADEMRPDDPVLVLAATERSYVLPWWVMKNHHVANLTIEGRPVTVTLCERCSSAAAFDGRVDGAIRTFQVVGMWKGTHVVADHETESIWTSFSGECIWGVHRGKQLEHLPLLQTSWQGCDELPRSTVVVDGAGEPREGHGSDRWPGSNEAPLGNFAEIDTRLPHNLLVLGVRAGGAARAYVLDELQSMGGVVNDAVGGVEIVVLGGPAEYTALAFERRIADETLRFERDGACARDVESGSLWDMTGLAVSGPRMGERLRFVYSLVEEWYAWAAYHPETDIAGR